VEVVPPLGLAFVACVFSGLRHLRQHQTQPLHTFLDVLRCGFGEVQAKRVPATVVQVQIVAGTKRRFGEGALQEVAGVEVFGSVASRNMPRQDGSMVVPIGENGFSSASSMGSRADTYMRRAGADLALEHAVVERVGATTC